MAVIMGITIFVFNLLNNTSVIDAVYILASYTYGPILGLFAFGIFMKQQVRDKYIPLVAIVSPSASLPHPQKRLRKHGSTVISSAMSCLYSMHCSPSSDSAY